MKAREIDKKFDAGEDISQYFDTAKARRPEQELKQVNFDGDVKSPQKPVTKTCS